MSIYCKRGFLRLACTGQDGLSSNGCLHTGKAKSPEQPSLCIWSPLQSQADLETWKISREPWSSIHIGRIKKWNLMSEDNGCSGHSSRCTDQQEAKANSHTLLFNLRSFISSPPVRRRHLFRGKKSLPSQQQILSGSSLTDIQRMS